MTDINKYKFANSEQKFKAPLVYNKIDNKVNALNVKKQLKSAVLYEPSSLVYEEMEKEIRPLDLIFFSGTEFVSQWIRDMSEFTRHSGDWSHVGIVVNKKIMPNLNVTDSDDTLFVWESTISSIYNVISVNHTLDAESGKPFFGVQVRRLNDVIIGDLKTKSSVVGWSKLIDNPIDRNQGESDSNYSTRFAQLQSNMMDLHKKYYRRPYQMNLFKLCMAMFPIFKSDTSLCCASFGNNWIFCSQLVALVYKKLQIFPEELDASRVIPEDIDNPATALQKIPAVVIPAVVIKLNDDVEKPK